MFCFRYIEILFDPVPNLDEVAFGSDWNKKFRMEGKKLQKKNLPLSYPPSLPLTLPPSYLPSLPPSHPPSFLPSLPPSLPRTLPPSFVPSLPLTLPPSQYTVSSDLKVPDYATNRGGPSTLEWSNLYWANRIAGGLGSKQKIVALSISG